MSDLNQLNDPPHPLDERLRELAADYHRPPATPREDLWRGIRARLGTVEPGSEPAAESLAEREIVPIAPARARPPLRGRELRGRGVPWLRTAAAAAMVALGFALGRFSGPRLGLPDAPDRVPVAAAPAASGEDVFRAAAARHLVRSEELLTLVRTDARAGHVDRAVGEWGEALLVETRLLLDSPAGSDPELKPVLDDLELLLAQVALLARLREGVEGGRGREELRLIAAGMEAQDMLPRIQAVLPAQAGS